MGSVSRELNARLTLDATGYQRGIAQSASVTTSLRTGLAGMATELGGVLVGMTGLTLGVGGLAFAMRGAVAEIGEMQQSQLRLKLATGENADELVRYQSIISSTPRGGIFDDNDVARAAAMAKVMELSVDEFERLLPSIRGLAAATPGATIEGVFGDVARAINTGMIRPLIQYGITQGDIERQSRKFYDAEFKDLDEVAKRYAALQAVLEKSSLFASGEQEALRTLPGVFSALRTEMGEMLEDWAGPGANALLKFMVYMREQDTNKGFALKGTGMRVVPDPTRFGEYVSEAIPQSVSESSSRAYVVAPNQDRGSSGVAAPGGRVVKPLDMGPSDKLDTRADQFDLRTRAREEAAEDRRREYDEERERQDILLDEAVFNANSRAEAEEIAAGRARAAWEANYALTSVAVGAFYGTVSGASLAFFRKEEGRQKNWAKMFGGAAQAMTAAVLQSIGQQAAAESAKYAAHAIGFMAIPGFQGSAVAAGVAAAKFAAIATGFGIASSAMTAASERSLGGGSFLDEEEQGRGRGRGTTGGVSTGANRISGIATRPIEHLTINFGMTVNAGNIFWGVNEQAAQDFVRQSVAAEIEKLVKGGGISVN